MRKSHAHTLSHPRALTHFLRSVYRVSINKTFDGNLVTKPLNGIFYLFQPYTGELHYRPVSSAIWSFSRGHKPLAATLLSDFLEGHTIPTKYKLHPHPQHDRFTAPLSFSRIWTRERDKSQVEEMIAKEELGIEVSCWQTEKSILLVSLLSLDFFADIPLYCPTDAIIQWVPLSSISLRIYLNLSSLTRLISTCTMIG